MDKYYGINRAETHSVQTEYEIRHRVPKMEAKQNGQNGSSFFIRCVMCALVVLVCVVGKFTSIGIAQKASGFIKDELNRDSIEQLTEYVEDMLNKE